MNPGLDVLLEGEWQPGAIHAPLDPHWQIRISPELEEHVSREWEAAAAEAATHRRLLFPGSICRVLGYSATPERLHLSLGISDYRQFLGTRDLADPAFRADPLTACAVIVTSDSKILVGRRSQNNFEGRGNWHLVAGYVDPTLDGDGVAVDVFHSISREAEEEVGFASADVFPVCLGMVFWPIIHKFELLFSARTPRTSSELRCPDGEEHDEIRAIDDHPKAIGQFLDEADGNIAASGRACLARYTAWRFGVVL